MCVSCDHKNLFAAQLWLSMALAAGHRTRAQMARCLIILSAVAAKGPGFVFIFNKRPQNTPILTSCKHSPAHFYAVVIKSGRLRARSRAQPALSTRQKIYRSPRIFRLVTSHEPRCAVCPSFCLNITCNSGISLQKDTPERVANR
jgi:hypothetical protein